MVAPISKSHLIDKVAPYGSRGTSEPDMPPSYPPRLIAIEDVRRILGLKNSAIHAKVASGELPAPIKFGESRRAAARWIESEIACYVMAKAAARRVFNTAPNDETA